MRYLVSVKGDCVSSPDTHSFPFFRDIQAYWMEAKPGQACKSVPVGWQSASQLRSHEYAPGRPPSPGSILIKGSSYCILKSISLVYQGHLAPRLPPCSNWAVVETRCQTYSWKTKVKLHCRPILTQGLPDASADFLKSACRVGCFHPTFSFSLLHSGSDLASQRTPEPRVPGRQQRSRNAAHLCSGKQHTAKSNPSLMT